MVGETGFEPATPWSRTRCSTRLSHSPTVSNSRCHYFPLGRGGRLISALRGGRQPGSFRRGPALRYTIPVSGTLARFVASRFAEFFERRGWVALAEPQLFEPAMAHRLGFNSHPDLLLTAHDGARLAIEFEVSRADPVAADGSVANRRHLGRAAFERGIPDGMCVDVEGDLWVAHVGGRRVAKLNPQGELIGEIRVPAKAVASVAFGGPGHDELYIVTADNLDDPGKGGSIFRSRPGVSGVATPLARV